MCIISFSSKIFSTFRFDFRHNSVDNFMKITKIYTNFDRFKNYVLILLQKKRKKTQKMESKLRTKVGPLRNVLESGRAFLCEVRVQKINLGRWQLKIEDFAPLA